MLRQAIYITPRSQSQLSSAFVASIFVILILLIGTSAFAQSETNSNRGRLEIALRLMQEQRCDDALPILELLHRNEPNAFIYFDRLIECEIELKKYDRALELVQKYKVNGSNKALTGVIEGEIQFFLGNEELAFNLWNENLKTHPQMLQLYINTARTMVNRKAFDQALLVYEKAQINFKNPMLFNSEIPMVHMQAGNYDKAVKSWLALIQNSPNQATGFQRILFRYNDPLLYDISIIELEDLLSRLQSDDPLYSKFYELQIWLLLETNLFERAFNTALRYEENTPALTYSLYSVGNQLLQNREYEKALNSFHYYSNIGHNETRWQALEKQAEVWLSWVKYLEDYDLIPVSDKSYYTEQARELLSLILSEAPNYQNSVNVHLRLAELYLDFDRDLVQAQKIIQRLERLTDNFSEELNYLKGRLAITNESFTEARLLLARSNRSAKVGEMAERTRYYLALSDFYSQDYEFSALQLKSLGRQYTSYYANNALELRLWLQIITAMDSTSQFNITFPKAMLEELKGNNAKAKAMLWEIARDHSNPFSGYAFKVLYSLGADLEDYVTTLNDYLVNQKSTPLRENLMWLRAQAAFYLSAQDSSSISSETLYSYYEDLILSFPSGFYSPLARKVINDLNIRS
tara:strand:- start:1397 stop:3298 length:1902 start_codon:yes stop_codon:yes gene_type:complete